MSKPHVIFVPGAWHLPTAFSIVSSKLEAHGYTVHSIRMPAVGNPNPPKDLSEDIAALQDTVTKAIGDGNDVIVVPHSWAGVVSGSALPGFGKKQREEKGEKGGVVNLAYMCAFLVPENVSLIDAAGGKVPDWYAVEEPYSVVKDGTIFYNGVDNPEQWISGLLTHSWATMTSKATGAAWKEIPTSYLVCEEDQAIPAFAQEAMANSVKEAGRDIEITRIKTGHSPFLSTPDAVVDWVRGIAGEKV